MMSSEQRKIVIEVYNHLIDNEERGWDELDEYIEYLEYLDDDQLHREADVVYEKHALGSPRCTQVHEKSKCFVPLLFSSVEAILELYKETNSMHPKNKYILQYYLAMTHSNMIIVDFA